MTEQDNNAGGNLAKRNYPRIVLWVILLLAILFIIAAAILPSNKAFYNWVQSRHKQNETPALNNGEKGKQ
jgi:hypothetical protein